MRERRLGDLGEKKEIDMKRYKMIPILLLVAADATAGAYKCPLPDGSFSFQQQPCTITTGDANRIDAKPLPGTGEGLRDGEKELMLDYARRDLREAELRLMRAEMKLKGLYMRRALER